MPLSALSSSASLSLSIIPIGFTRKLGGFRALAQLDEHSLHAFFRSDAGTQQIFDYADNIVCVLFLFDFARSFIRAPKEGSLPGDVGLD